MVVKTKYLAAIYADKSWAEIVKSNPKLWQLDPEWPKADKSMTYVLSARKVEIFSFMMTNTFFHQDWAAGGMHSCIINY